MSMLGQILAGVRRVWIWRCSGSVPPPLPGWSSLTRCLQSPRLSLQDKQIYGA
jgi:hypothetical protein